jgi:hypothetical protein
MVTHILFETASGYAIFKAKFHEDIGAKTRAMQESITDFSKFSKMVDLVSFFPFKSAAQALENANDVSEGEGAIVQKKKSAMMRHTQAVSFQGSSMTISPLFSNSTCRNPPKNRLSCWVCRILCWQETSKRSST